MTFAFMLLFFRNDTGFGGNNGFTDFKRILGYSDRRRRETRMALFVLTGATLIGTAVCAAGWCDVEVRPRAAGGARRGDRA